MRKITIVAGARPNFIKVAPIVHEIIAAKGRGALLDYRLIHTGQHYDVNMSKDFFEQLHIPEPNRNLNSGGGTQIEQVSKIMISFERELLEFPPDLVLVVGDVTSTMACTIVAKLANIQVAHVEAGIRSGDRSMPEEINRLVTDSISDLFFTTSRWASGNLQESGIDESKIFFVGNTMIDTLAANRKKFKKPSIWNLLDLQEKNYVVVTLHRPSNVDSTSNLRKIIEQLVVNCEGIPIIFPMHPRTRAKFESLKFICKNLHVLPPLPYLEFNFLVEKAKVVVTDSGGITEETTCMNIPCMTLRDTTERPETVNQGTNELIGSDPKGLSSAFNMLRTGQWKNGAIPEMWDGRTSQRIVEVLTAI